LKYIESEKNFVVDFGFGLRESDMNCGVFALFDGTGGKIGIF
jgi:hypothetical protein